MNWSCIRNEQQYSLGVVLWQKKKQVSQKIERIISAHNSLSLLIIKIGGTCRNTSAAGCTIVFLQTTQKNIFIGVSSSLMGVSANWLSVLTSPFRCVGSTLHKVNDMFSEYYACVNPPPIPQSAYLGYEKHHLFGSLGTLFIPHLAPFLE